MRDDYPPGVLASEKRNRDASEIGGAGIAPARWASHRHLNLAENDTSPYLAAPDTSELRTVPLPTTELDSGNC